MGQGCEASQEAALPELDADDELLGLELDVLDEPPALPATKASPHPSAPLPATAARPPARITAAVRVLIPPTSEPSTSLGPV
jgi:hypothetical protein